MKIELKGLTKSYGSTRALDNLSLSIAPGQIVGILGIPGAGKTTLLRCLAGIAGPDDGQILFDGVEFRRDRLDLRKRIFTLLEHPAFLTDQTVLRNISIILRLYDADTEEMETKVVSLLKEFGLLPFAMRVVSSLASAQQYQVGLVTLLALDREVWLMDEPFAVGQDDQTMESFRNHAQEAAKRGRTLLYSTAILKVAERFSDQVMVFERGELKGFDMLEKLRHQNKGLEEIFQELVDKDKAPSRR
jgi:ABC-type multidrug transport system ATPase subunit